MTSVPHQHQVEVVSLLKVADNITTVENGGPTGPATKNNNMILINFGSKDDLLVSTRAGPLECVDELKDSGVVADYVEISVVHEGSVMFQKELDVRLGRSHEVVQHGLVDVSRAKLEAAHVDGFPGNCFQVFKYDFQFRPFL